MKSNMINTCVKLGLVEPKTANFLEFLFDCMRVAEEEIAAAIKKDNKRRGAIDETFKHACVTQPLRLKRSLTLYRAHVRELIARMVAGEDVRPGTKAEVLATLSEVSFAAPLPQQPYALFIRLFSEIYPQHMKAIGNPEWKKIEAWPGSTDQLLNDLTRKLRSERGIEPKPKKKKGASFEIHSQEASGISTHPKNGDGRNGGGMPPGRGRSLPVGGRKTAVQHRQGNRREPPRRRPLD
jgi:hypothetical protein